MSRADLCLVLLLRRGSSDLGIGRSSGGNSNALPPFAIGFSFISVTTGIFATYGSVLNWGGPLGIWTWPISVLGQVVVALVFAALAARIPLAGYSYQWASRLANPMIGWFLGWVSFTFLMVALVSVDYSVWPRPFCLACSIIPKQPGNAWLITALV